MPVYLEEKPRVNTSGCRLYADRRTELAPYSHLAKPSDQVHGSFLLIDPAAKHDALALGAVEVSLEAYELLEDLFGEDPEEEGAPTGVPSAAPVRTVGPVETRVQALEAVVADQHVALAAREAELTDAALTVEHLAADLARATAALDAHGAAAAIQASVRGLNRIVVAGTAVVLLSVATLVYVGGFAAARDYAGFAPLLAALVPLCIEAGAAVELAGLVRDRRLGVRSHWTARVLATGLLSLSIVGMVLHATKAPAGSFGWWGYVIAAGLPLELAALIRSALGGDKSHARIGGH